VLETCKKNLKWRLLQGLQTLKEEKFLISRKTKVVTVGRRDPKVF
jgi:hypothetical protein